MSSPQQEPWWARAVFYQVYPRSFADSDSDGVGEPRRSDVAAGTIWTDWASRRCGLARSWCRRWPTMATTWRIRETWIRCSAAWPLLSD